MSVYNSKLLALVDVAAKRPPVITKLIVDSQRPSMASDGESHSMTPENLSYIGQSSSLDYKDKSTRKKNHALPVVLMKLLMDEEKKDVMKFVPDGESFAILRAHAFSAEMMKPYFNCVKFPTFVKKMEKWGFRLISNNTGQKYQVIFRHTLFHRGDWKSCRQIRCMGNKRAHSSQAPCPTAITHTNSSSGLAYSEKATLINASAPRSPSPKATLDERVAAMTKYLCPDKITRNGSLPYFSQAEVNRATDIIVGAAIESLVRDRVNPLG